MPGYSFTCPLTGCDHLVMTSSAPTEEDAAAELTAIAEKHLQEVHTDVHKTHEEVDADIRAHMHTTG